ncbi:MAG TPA: universal stress protein [Xenococcaceae cyanobacterium]|jgi:nucleotide-binding universal stress UspA family protein
MYKNILVAIDNSELSQRAFEQALSLAKTFQANLHLLHVLSPLQAEYQDTASLAFSNAYYPDAGDEFYRERWTDLEATGLELLRSLSDQATQAGVITEFTQQVGQIDQTIVEFAKSHQTDLLVVGSHGRKGLSEFFLGSVSNYVSHHVNCSVLLVH